MEPITLLTVVGLAILGVSLLAILGSFYDFSSGKKASAVYSLLVGVFLLLYAGSVINNAIKYYEGTYHATQEMQRR